MKNKLHSIQYKENINKQKKKKYYYTFQMNHLSKWNDLFF